MIDPAGPACTPDELRLCAAVWSWVWGRPAPDPLPPWTREELHYWIDHAETSWSAFAARHGALLDAAGVRRDLFTTITDRDALRPYIEE